MSTTTTTYTSSFAPSTFAAPQRKTMSITQTYFLAHKARAKLSSQAARPDHNLRLLVGHANLLDTLMLELADAEREQESWFNQSVRGASQNNKTDAASSTQKADRHVQWADTVIEEPEEDWQAEDADDDSDASSDASSDYSDSDEEDEEDNEDEVYDDELSPASSIEVDEDILMADAAPLHRVSSHKAAVVEDDAEETEDDEEIEEDDEASHAHLTLTRSPSHSSSAQHMSSPPELVIEEDSDVSSEDDESMPPSPPAVTLQSFDKKAAAAVTTTAIRAVPSSSSPQQDVDEHDAFEHDSTAHYYLPPRNPARLITALSVY
ncbi:hypothetical protein SCUCBS95973_001284 [Sporothrix curviconia]|uniref:Protein ECM13 n=1 Tax=Sporothrix curviconia TaxID=1260050 RepID=A0ABP0AXG4_9PEZI